MSPMDTRLARLMAPIDAGMARVRERITEELRGDSDAVADMTAHISRFRGKQLRAALVLLCGSATRNDDPELPDVAAIVEMIHLATLVHDDVLDGADVRRRVASVNRRWDNQVAVLLGDLLYARAFHLSTRLSSPLCSSLLSTTTQRICVGEIDQAASRYDFEMTDERYEAIAGAKTAVRPGIARCGSPSIHRQNVKLVWLSVPPMAVVMDSASAASRLRAGRCHRAAGRCLDQASHSSRLGRRTHSRNSTSVNHPGPYTQAPRQIARTACHRRRRRRRH